MFRWNTFIFSLNFYLVLFVSGLIFSPSSFAVKFYFETEVVDNSGSVGSDAHLDVNPSGNPAIAYRDNTGNRLRYAVKSGGSWSFETAYSGSSNEVSMAHDSAGNVGISFHQNWDLQYVSKTGGVWNAKEVAASSGSTGRNSSIAFDSSNDPTIVYRSFTGQDFLFAKKTGGAWSSQIVASNVTGGVGTAVGGSLAFDNSGEPAFSYKDNQSADEGLYYAKQTSGVWSIQKVDAAPFATALGYFNSLAFDGSNFPHISYRGGLGNNEMAHAYFDGAAWQTEVIESVIPFESSIKIDSTGDILVAYPEGTNNEIKFARKSGGAWTVETITTFSSVPIYLSMDIDSSGVPYIAYQNPDTSNLEMAFAAPGNLLDGNNASVDLDGGSSTSGGVSVTMDVTGDGRIRKEAYGGSDSDFTVASFIGDVFSTMELTVDDAVLNGTATLVFNYTDILGQLAATGLGESDIRIFHDHPVNGLEQLSILAQDLGANTITVSTDSFSPFAVGVNPEPATLFLLGSALFGWFPFRKKTFR